MGASSGLRARAKPTRSRAGGRGGRSRRLGPLLGFAAAMAAGRTAAARRALAAARRAGLARVAAEETALMLMLHAGYPAALEGARALNEAWPGRARRTREGTPRDWTRRGRALCARVYGPAFPRLERNVAA